MKLGNKGPNESNITRRSLLGSAGVMGAGMMFQTAAAVGQIPMSSAAAVPKITSIKASIHYVPVNIPLLNKPSKSQIVFVEVNTDQGLTGYGLTGNVQVSGVANFINLQLAPFLKGKNVLDTEARWQEMFLTFNNRWQTGVWSSAVSAIDIALWDIKGKYYKAPVWRLLGGAKKKVQAYLTFGAKEYDKDQLVEMAKRHVAEGQDKLKMELITGNGENWQEDAARIKAVREAIGDKIDLGIDGNEQWSINRALQLCNRIEQYDITWFEEPLFGNDPRLMAQLRQRCSIPISGGQNEGSRYRHLELLQQGAVDILQPNVCFVGGYTEGLKVAALAQAFDIMVADGGGWALHNAHLLGGVSNGWRVEIHYHMTMVTNLIYKNSPQVDKGWVTLTDAPGLGLEPNLEALNEFLKPPDQNTEQNS
jgi:L-rhamnonate dehydratase